MAPRPQVQVIVAVVIVLTFIRSLHQPCQLAVYSSDPTTVISRIIPSISALYTLLRIMIAVTAYDLNQFPHFNRMYDSFRDMCESGYTVDLFIYTTVDWPRDILESLESRIRCRRPSAQFSVSMVLKDAEVGVNLARYHKALFHDNVDIIMISSSTMRMTILSY